MKRKIVISIILTLFVTGSFLISMHKPIVNAQSFKVFGAEKERLKETKP